MRKITWPLLLLILYVVVYHSYFDLGLLNSNDFPFYSGLMIKSATLSIYAWDSHVVLDGFARFISPYSWIFPVLSYPQVLLGKLGFDWSMIERISYFFPLLILSVISPIILIKHFFPQNKFYLIGVLIFSFNTYSLLLFGSQVFLAIAYVLIPIVFVLFSILISKAKNRLNLSLITGLVLGLQMLIETRVAVITIFLVIFYALFYWLFNFRGLNKNKIKDYIADIIFVFLIPFLTTFLLHAFWIVPSILYGRNPVEALGAAYSTSGAVNYLSFAKFENTISLLHPNWPENIFGKVYFMRPEFLLIPVLAFASLLFINKLKNKQEKLYILFFTLLGLVGAFLAKGSNEPFGGVYLWLFNHFPGFELFRDPAKWYPLVAISYTVLIPFSVWKIYEWLKSRDFLIKSKFFNFQNLFILFSIIFLLFLIRPAFFGQLGGMFKTTVVPKEYARLESFLYNQNQYFRTLWVPQKQRFGYYSNVHPEISAQVLFNLYDNKKLLDKLSKKDSEIILQQSAVRFVIVPYDSEGEIFLSDRKYSEKEYQGTINAVQKIPWLKEIPGFGRIKVFEVPQPKDHFWLIGEGQIQYKSISPVEYQVTVKNVQKGEVLVFSEKFDKNWIANSIKSTPHNIFNSFVLPADGNYTLKVYFQPQDWVNIGVVVSILSLTSVLGLLIFGYVTKKW